VKDASPPLLRAIEGVDTLVGTMEAGDRTFRKKSAGFSALDWACCRKTGKKHNGSSAPRPDSSMRKATSPPSRVVVKAMDDAPVSVRSPGSALEARKVASLDPSAGPKTTTWWRDPSSSC
jgi:hypothetical protein